MRSFQRRLAEFDTRGIRVVGISSDPVEVLRQYTEKLGFTYPLLSDSNAEVARRYDLLHPGAGPGGSDIARPAEFLIDSGGVVRWLNLTDSATARARPEQVLEAIDQMPR